MSNPFAAMETLSSGTNGDQRTSSAAERKGEYRRLHNDMQIVGFKVRALEEKLDKLMKDTDGGNETKHGSGRNAVAFTARLSTNRTFRSQQTILFDDVMTNVGNAYDVTSGTFKAPCAGRFLFSLTVRAQYHKQACAEIVAEPEVIGVVAAGDTEIERASSSLTVVTSLSLGDVVHVREMKMFKGDFYGDGFTVFTGVLLQ
ncbi:complement C1q-like protein 4 [Dreissena polymorpha]|uniref:C1q domain-containing protein n=1 Tax=Dreissena polymorpha TaxID=45954 RepID=A0A9D3Y5F4_DREPO|nr:complement C1q-like protein 4 [Dreissena polymorpha]KAH3693665.1 hypothetical protein DPMN_081105 [Dreissena polymorpha]